MKSIILKETEYIFVAFGKYKVIKGVIDTKIGEIFNLMFPMNKGINWHSQVVKKTKDFDIVEVI